MSANEIDRILAAIEELKAEVVALKSWQTLRDKAEEDHRIRVDERKRWLKLAVSISQSRVTPWIFAAAGVVWATLR